MGALPEWLVNIGMHAVSGFLIGFSAAFVANPSPSLPDLTNAIYGASVIGLYSCIKEVAAYVQTLVGGNTTAAGKNEAPKPLLKRML